MVPQARFELAKALLLRQVGVPVSISHRGKILNWQRVKDSNLRGHSQSVVPYQLGEPPAEILLAIQTPGLNRTVMASPLGIEPKPTVLETVVLPVTPGRYISWAERDIGSPNPACHCGAGNHGVSAYSHFVSTHSASPMHCTYNHRVAVGTLSQVPGGVDSRLALVANTDEMRRGRKSFACIAPHFVSDGADTLLHQRQQRLVPAPSHGIEFLMNLTQRSTMRSVQCLPTAGTKNKSPVPCGNRALGCEQPGGATCHLHPV